MLSQLFLSINAQSAEGISGAVLRVYLHKFILLCITECYLGIGIHSMLFLPAIS
jgi:hypothetical protein